MLYCLSFLLHLEISSIHVSIRIRIRPPSYKKEQWPFSDKQTLLLPIERGKVTS